MTGFTITPDWITESEEAQLVERLRPLLAEATEKDGGSGRSAVVRFGWDYNDEHKWVRDIPEWISELDVLKAHFGVTFDSVTVNLYEKGQTITPHIDSLNFGEPIVILSLLSIGLLCFSSVTRPEARLVVCDIPARSLVSLSSEARYKYQHSIAPVKAERISVVFRKRIL